MLYLIPIITDICKSSTQVIYFIFMTMLKLDFINPAKSISERCGPVDMEFQRIIVSF